MKKPLNPHIEKVTKLAAETAVQTALDFLEKEKRHQQKQRKDRRLRNTKLLLRHYRSFKDHCADVKVELERLNDPEFLGELDTDEFAIESIRRSKERTMAMVRFIDQMLLVYRIACEQSEKLEELRRYKTIEMMYISDEKFTVEQIAEKNDIDIRTVYRDIKEAVKVLSALIFGVDGVRMID